MIELFLQVQGRVNNLGLEGPKAECTLVLGCYFLMLLISTDLPARRAVEAFSEKLLEFSVENPPQHRLILTLSEMKGVFAFFAQEVFPRFEEYSHVLRSKKQLHLKPFQMFARKMPHDLGLEFAKPVENPLGIPALRKLLLKPGQVYFTDTEISSIMKEGRLGQLSAAEQKYVLTRADKLEHDEKINKVVDQKLQLLKSQMQEKLNEVVDEVAGAEQK